MRTTIYDTNMCDGLCPEGAVPTAWRSAFAPFVTAPGRRIDPARRTSGRPALGGAASASHPSRRSSPAFRRAVGRPGMWFFERPSPRTFATDSGRRRGPSDEMTDEWWRSTARCTGVHLVVEGAVGLLDPATVGANRRAITAVERTKERGNPPSQHPRGGSVGGRGKGGAEERHRCATACAASAPMLPANVVSVLRRAAPSPMKSPLPRGMVRWPSG